MLYPACGGVELVEYPHAMLSRGQDRFRVVFCGRERNAIATASRSRGADSGSDVRGELACCRVLEYLSHVDVDVEDLAQTHGQSRCDQRIAALVEEAACDINGFEVQEFTEYRRDGFFQSGHVAGVCAVDAELGPAGHLGPVCRASWSAKWVAARSAKESGAQAVGRVKPRRSL